MLEAAGERLRLGWIQGAFETTLTVNEQKTPAFCLVGALRSATRALRADGDGAALELDEAAQLALTIPGKS